MMLIFMIIMITLWLILGCMDYLLHTSETVFFSHIILNAIWCVGAILYITIERK